MAYSNWGENLANSFMSMYQANNQKKLEAERMGIERDRLGLERQRTEDAMKTNLLQRTQMEAEMARREREDAYFLANQINLDMDKNPDNGKEFGVDARYAGLFNPYAYENYGVNTVGANGIVVNTPTYMQNYMAPSLLESAGQSLNANVTMREGDKNRTNSRENAQIGASAAAANTALLRQQTVLENRQTATQKLGEYMETINWQPSVSQEGDMIDILMLNYDISYRDAVNMVEAAKNSRPRGSASQNNRPQGTVVRRAANGGYPSFNPDFVYTDTLIGD